MSEKNFMGVNKNWWSVRELLEELIHPPVKKSPPVSPPIGGNMIEGTRKRYDSKAMGLRLICICCGYRYLNYTGPASVLPSCPSCGAILEVQEDG